MLDEVGSRWALGGSMASSLVGEPRSTLDVDIAVNFEGTAGQAFLEKASREFYVPLDAARAAIEARTSFNVVDVEQGLKADLFVLGDGLLDRMQINRRVSVTIPGIAEEVWVTSPEDQVLRKLDWYRRTGEESNTQWRDVIGIIRVHGEALDYEYLNDIARQIGLAALLDRASRAATDE
jgi:hypothetical protein